MMSNNINHQKLTKREKYLLEREQKEKERLKGMQSKGKKKIIMIALLLILVAGGIFGLLNYLPRGGQGAQKESQDTSKPLKAEKLKFEKATRKTAPDFVLQDIDGNAIKLSDYRGKIVVLFFNEGAMCYPACWDQMTAFGNDEKFNTNDVVVFSILIDQKSEWEKIVSQSPQFSKAKILFDSDRKISAAYDVLSLPSSMHPPSPMHPGGYPGHTYFIIDREGIIRYTFDDPEMGLRNDILFSEISKI